MEEHERLLLAECPLPAELVGSYRRGASSSGDIDVLIRVPPHQTAKDTKSMFYYFVQRLVDKGYIKAILALGEHKCMAICSLDKDATARRLDLLITPDEEYPFALLYFTGSDRFNVAVRQRALERGYTLNEHRLTPILKESGEHRLTPLSAGQPLQTSTPSASREHRILALQAPRALQTPILKESGEHRLTPTLHTEEDILHFLGLEYVPPTERTDMTSLTEWTPPLRMRRPVMSPATSSSTSVSKA
jgi:DNA polymerase/3'-5' exonuclease PolX